MSDTCPHTPTAPIVWHASDLTALCGLCRKPIRMVDADKCTHGPWKEDS